MGKGTRGCGKSKSRTVNAVMETWPRGQETCPILEEPANRYGCMPTHLRMSGKAERESKVFEEDVSIGRSDVIPSPQFLSWLDGARPSQTAMFAGVFCVYSCVVTTRTE